METKYLLPHRFKIIGWVIFIIAAFLGVWQMYFGAEPEWLTFEVPALFGGNMLSMQNEAATEGLMNSIENNWSDEITAILLLVSSLLLVFSKEKGEDEFIMKLRLEALLWSALVNALLLVFCILFVYGFAFLNVMIFNLFLLFFLFIIRFQWVLFKHKRMAE